MATYLVTNKNAPEGSLPRMVDARTAASAVSHVARDEYGAVPISTKQAVQWALKGVVHEDTAAQPEPEVEAEAKE